MNSLKKTKLVSAIHNISVSKPLAEPYKLEIQHCVKLETHAQADCLHFVRALSSPTTLPYQFALVEGGQFYPGSRHGVIDITCESSCLVAIVADEKEQSQENNEESYIIKKGIMNQVILNKLLQCNIFSSYRFQSRDHPIFIICIHRSNLL